MSTEKRPEQLRTAAQQVAQTDWKAIGKALGEALEGLGKDMRLLAQHQKECRELAALYELHRLYRFRPAGAPPRAETMAMINTALDNYDFAYLEQLTMFGGFLADAAGKRYASR